MITSTNKKYVNRRERASGVICVVTIFVVGLCVVCGLLFSDKDVSKVFKQKDTVNIKMKRQQNFKRIQDENTAVCDLVAKKIIHYDPSVNAVFEKDEIQYMINELRRKYGDNQSDRRYLVFQHMSSFYEMWFKDRQQVWSLSENVAYFKENLEECELGLVRKKETINSR